MTTALAAILSFFAYPLVVCIFGVLLSGLFIAAAEHKDDDYDSIHGVSIFFTVIAGLVYYKQIFAFLSDWSWYFLLLAVLGYAILGGINSVFRWRKYCDKFTEEHPADSIKELIWERGNSRPPTAEEQEQQAEKFYKSSLEPRLYKNRLIAWIVYWPWSVFWNFLGDFFTGIYDALINVYNNITSSAIRKAMKNRQVPNINH